MMRLEKRIQHHVRKKVRGQLHYDDGRRARSWRASCTSGRSRPAEHELGTALRWSDGSASGWCTAAAPTVGEPCASTVFGAVLMTVMFWPFPWPVTRRRRGVAEGRDHHEHRTHVET